MRGSEALDLLKAWGTGHPGGIGTIHAGSGIGALRRLEQLMQEAVVTVPRALIAETIDPDTLALEKLLSDVTGMKVVIAHKSGGGELRVSYRSLDQLDDLCRRLKQA